MTANLTQHKVGGQEQDQNLVFLQQKQHVRLEISNNNNHQLTNRTKERPSNLPTGWRKIYRTD